ncbi:MAG: bifunctional nuclease family protein [Desulfobacterales bacterium]|nr:bifunctional nuclease family protein [Desulfobacterales bacterium]MCP4163770.1 bifunctional nuclease family protein [Deltaproteobacteria bacterium]
MLHEATISSLTIDPNNQTPLLLLKLKDEEITVPIMIGLLEAGSIAAVLQEIVFDRPMTHDLFTNFINKVDVKIDKIEIIDILNNTFYAKLYFSDKDGQHWIDSRPSDAIAMAIRAGARIYIEDEVIQKLKTEKDFEAMDNSEEGSKWADYLSNLTDDDFGKYKV